MPLKHSRRDLIDLGVDILKCPLHHDGICFFFRPIDPLAYRVGLTLKFTTLPKNNSAILNITNPRPHPFRGFERWFHGVKVVFGGV